MPRFLLVVVLYSTLLFSRVWAQLPTITTSSVQGNISACQGTPSSMQNIESFTISGSSLTGNIIATAPTNFEVSLNPNNSYGNSVTVTATGGAITNIQVYVRSAASAAAGKIAGNIVLTSPGAASDDVAVTGVVNSQPTVTVQPASQELAAGATTQPVDFTGTANTFTWTNDTPTVGLAAGGTGNIPAFTAINNTNNKVTATLTVVPQLIGYAYITNQQANTVSVINTATNTVVKTIPVGQTPTGATVSPDGSKVYITNQRSSSISIISTSTNQVISTIQLPTTTPIGIALSPDGTKIYVVNLSMNSMSVIDAATGNIISTVKVGGYPVGVVASPDGNNVFVMNSSDNISDYNTINGSVSTIPVANGPYDACISPDGSKLYITNTGGNSVTVINIASHAIITTIPVGTAPEGINISPDGNTIYVTNVSSGNVSVINTGTNQVVSTIQVGSGPTGVCVTPDGSFVYITNQNSNSVSVISTATNSVTTTVPVGALPESLGNFIIGGSGCSGNPVTFTITVDPASLAPTITASIATGNIIVCEGTASASPYIQTFTVSGNNLQGDITITAPAAFEISSAPGNGYSGSSVIQEAAGAISSVVIYARSAASDAAANISGNVLITSTGAVTQTVALNGTVNALPTVDKVTSQTVAGGDMTTAVNFNGTGSLFDWTNDNPSIGLAASGTGNILPFTAINTGKSNVTATITVTPRAATEFAYVASRGGQTITVINTLTNTIVATIPSGAGYGVAISPDGTRAYIADDGSGDIKVVNTQLNSIIATITVPGTSYLGGIAVSTDGGRIYVANSEPGTVSVINAVTNTVTATIKLGQLLSGVAANPNGKWLYVANLDVNVINVIDAATNKLSASIPIGQSPSGVNISPDGSKLYVTCSLDNDLWVINTADNSLIAKIPVGAAPFEVAVSPDGGSLYVSNFQGNTVSIIETQTNKVISTVATGGGPSGISVTPDNSETYIVNSVDNTVSVLNNSSKQVIQTIAIAADAISLGNFIVKVPGCPGNPVTFTITVTPSANNTAQILAIPNTFTPNGDGINDTWEIKSLENYPNCTVQVYNRWGEKLYSSIGYPIPWDGTYKGANLPVGTYYYIINLKNGVNAISGWVAIIK